MYDCCKVYSCSRTKTQEPQILCDPGITLSQPVLYSEVSMLLGSTKGELVWLKQPDGTDPWMRKWEETVLVYGSGAPDTFLISVNVSDGVSNRQSLITAGFFSQSLDLWGRTDETKPWTPNNVRIGIRQMYVRQNLRTQLRIFTKFKVLQEHQCQQLNC